MRHYHNKLEDNLQLPKQYLGIGVTHHAYDVVSIVKTKLETLLKKKVL